jgi:hypothetical protein
LYEDSTVASQSCPTIPPTIEQVRVPPAAPVTVPVLNEFEIEQRSLPLFGPNSPTRPPTYFAPVTEPVNEEFVKEGEPLVHVVFWSPNTPKRPPTKPLPVTVADDETLTAVPLYIAPPTEPAE